MSRKCRSWVSPTDSSTAPFSTVPSVQHRDSKCHLFVVSFPGRAKSRNESDWQGHVTGRDILLLRQAIRNCSFGQILAAAIRLASPTPPLEDSASQCLTRTRFTPLMENIASDGYDDEKTSICPESRKWQRTQPFEEILRRLGPRTDHRRG